MVTHSTSNIAMLVFVVACTGREAPQPDAAAPPTVVTVTAT